MNITFLLQATSRILGSRPISQRLDGFCAIGFLAHPQASAHACSMSMLTLEQVSWAEKLQAMEGLWESLSQDEDRLESPAWHADALEETRQNHAAGREQPVDWQAAKQEVRKRRE